MKTKKMLFVGLVAVIFAVWGITSAALAAEKEAARGEANPELIFVGSLGTAFGATDVYHVHCFSPAARLFADVKDRGGVDGIRFNVNVMDSGGNPAQGITAPDGGLSFLISATGGPGAYYILISKSAFGTVENYDSFMQCRNSSGGNVTTTVTLVQNQ